MDARQAARPGSTDQPQQEGLGLIVACMAEGNGVSLKTAARPIEERIARFAAGRFHGSPLAPRTDGLIRATNLAQSLPGDLPPDSLFKPETPRYPNVWFYGPESDFPSYAKFVEWLDSRFRGAGYRPDDVSLNEGADIALSIEHLQPWTSVTRLSHAHALHIRFFWKRLEQAHADVVLACVERGRRVFMAELASGRRRNHERLERRRRRLEEPLDEWRAERRHPDTRIHQPPQQ